jgi:hypothetical protein
VSVHGNLAVPSWGWITAFALFALLLMPVDYRAGAVHSHPHALIQLIYEARLGLPVHQHAIQRSTDDHERHRDSTASPAGPDIASSQSSAPSLQIISSTALLPTILLVLSLLVLRGSRPLRSVLTPAGFSPTPTPPPPRR